MRVSRKFNTQQHTATHCNTLQHTATHCNTLQHTATHCNTLQNSAQFTSKLSFGEHEEMEISGEFHFSDCSVLQRVAETSKERRTLFFIFLTFFRQGTPLWAGLHSRVIKSLRLVDSLK